jgi:hypothetical protein
MCSGKGLMRTYWLVLPEEVYEYDQAHEAVAMPAVISSAGDDVILSRQASQRSTRRKPSSGRRSGDAMAALEGDAARRGSGRLSIFGNMLKRHRSSKGGPEEEAADGDRPEGGHDAEQASQEVPVLVLEQADGAQESVVDDVSITMPAKESVAKPLMSKYELQPVRMTEL